MAAKDPRSTRAYQAVRLKVIEQEPHCWLRFAGCKGRSTTADHIIPVKQCLAMRRPDLVLDRRNMHGACTACNYARQDKPVEAIRHLMGRADALRFFD